MKIHHVGYLVKDINASKSEFELLGYTVVGEKISDSIRNIDIVFMENSGVMVELVSPPPPRGDKEKDSIVKSLIKKTGTSPYHICYKVDSLEDTIKDLLLKKYIVIDRSKEAPALNNKKVAFLYHKNVGIIELLEG